MIRFVVTAWFGLGLCAAMADGPPRAETAPRRTTYGEPAVDSSVAFADLPGVATDDLAAAFAAFRASCAAVKGDIRPLRAAVPPPRALQMVCNKALALPRPVDEAAARAFFEANFIPRRVTTPAFFTGYFEPVVDGSLVRTAAFTAPLLAAPPGLRPGAQGTPATYRRSAGALASMPDRAAIEAGALGAEAPPLVWLREPVDTFFVQVQGSARVLLPDGALRRVAYAGRNGFPYTSIGKVLVDTLHVPPEQMGMSELRSWIAAHGQEPGGAGRALMDRNRSFIFFRFDDSLSPDAGPVGAAGVSLTALRSLAVDRTVWPYGLPVYAAADLPWQGAAATPFHRMMVAQDTGSGIVGPARADIFFGTGTAAAARAGAIRQPGTLYVLWPKGDDPRSAPVSGTTP